MSIEKGDITKELHVGPGEHVTQESLRKAQDFWFELYLFFMIMNSNKPEERERIQVMQEQLGIAHEAITSFLATVIIKKGGD